VLEPSSSALPSVQVDVSCDRSNDRENEELNKAKLNKDVDSEGPKNASHVPPTSVEKDSLVIGSVNLIRDAAADSDGLNPTDADLAIDATSDSTQEIEVRDVRKEGVEKVDQSELLKSKLDAAKNMKRKRSTVKFGEELDTKKFTLADLIDWRPATENTLRKKWDERRLQLSSNASSVESLNGASNSGNDVKQQVGPRVKMNEKGEMVLDEESLVVVEHVESNVWETVNDELMPKKLNSMSFRKCRRTALWTVIETDLFYEVLSATGTDFGLMHEFIPTRSRAELKKKFNREEKLDEERVNEILSKPTLLDETLYERVNKITRKIEEEQSAKEAKKAKKKKKVSISL